MDIATINATLYRPLLKGQRYDKYFRKSSCKSTKLAKGNTTVAIAEMAKWAFTYQQDTAKFVKQSDLNLTKTPFHQLAGKLHRFLFDHFQYKIDVSDQNLKSPACAWQTRAYGMDCKSYAIWISTCLLNLNIKHYLRRIKQLSIYPDSYTHVYIVIPLDQKTGKINNGYEIIDATLKINKEVSHIKKDDLFMEANLPIIGLAAPAQLPFDSMGCACENNDRLGFQRGRLPDYLGQPALQLGRVEYMGIASEALRKFEALIKLLEQFSPNKMATDMLRNLVKSKIFNGIDPVLRLTDTGIFVDRSFVNLKKTFENMRKFSNRFDGRTLAPELTDLIRSGSLGLPTAPDTLAPKTGGGLPISPLALISALIPKDFFDKTFGAVFANGFDLSCFNSTFTPAKVTAEVKRVHVPYFENLLAKASDSTSNRELEKNFNDLLKAVDISFDMYAVKLPQGANWRNCSKKAIQIYTDIVTGAKIRADILLENLQKTADITVANITTPAKFTYPAALTLNGADFSWSEAQHGNAIFRSIRINSDLFGELQNQIDQTVTDLTNTGGNGSGNINGNGQPDQAGFGGVGMLLLGGVIVGAIVLGTKKNDPKGK